MNTQGQLRDKSNFPNPAAEYELVSPDGSRIRGTLERIEAAKGIHRIKPDPAKAFSFEEDYERTEVFWDTQTTAKTAEGETLFIDDNGKTWPAPQLTIRPVARDR